MTGKIMNNHQRLRRWMPIFLVLLVSEIIFFATKILKVKPHGPVIPIEWGLIKDLVDAISVVVFPWHGWIFVVALFGAYFSSPDRLQLMTLLLASSILTSAISTYFNFITPTIANFATGLFAYLVINLFVFALIHSLKITAQWGSKCLR